MGGFNWDDVVSSGARSRQAAEEAFYGFGDFFRDLDRDRYSAAPPSSTVCNASGQHCTCCPSTIHYLACHGEGALKSCLFLQLQVRRQGCLLTDMRDDGQCRLLLCVHSL